MKFVEHIKMSENQPENGEAKSRHNGERLIHQLLVLSVPVISVEVSSTLSVREGVSLGSGLSVASFARLCMSISSFGKAQIGGRMSALSEAVRMGCMSVKDALEIGSSVSVLSFARFGSGLSTSSTLHEQRLRSRVECIGKLHQCGFLHSTGKSSVCVRRHLHWSQSFTERRPSAR